MVTRSVVGAARPSPLVRATAKVREGGIWAARAVNAAAAAAGERAAEREMAPEVELRAKGLIASAASPAGRVKSAEPGKRALLEEPVSCSTAVPGGAEVGRTASSALPNAAAAAAAPVQKGAVVRSSRPARGRAQQMGRGVLQSSQNSAPLTVLAAAQRPAGAVPGSVESWGSIPQRAMSTASTAALWRGVSPPPSGRPLSTTTSPTSIWAEAGARGTAGAAPQAVPRQSLPVGAAGRVPAPTSTLLLATSTPSSQAAAEAYRPPPTLLFRLTV